MQQHIAAGLEVGRLHPLDLVTADAVMARHEDHGGRDNSSDQRGIMDGTADHPAMRQPERPGGFRYTGNAAVIEFNRRHTHHPPLPDVGGMLVRRLAAQRGDLVFQPVEGFGFGMAKVDNETCQAGNGAGGVGLDLQLPDRHACVRGILPAEPATAAARQCADLRQLHVGVPQARAVDADIRNLAHAK